MSISPDFVSGLGCAVLKRINELGKSTFHGSPDGMPHPTQGSDGRWAFCRIPPGP